MPMILEGSCRCAAVAFRCDTNTPVPFQLCYCTICRKTAGGGGFAINLMAPLATLDVRGADFLGVYRATIEDDDGLCTVSTGQRHFCLRCGTALWLYDPTWPDLVHPFASAIDTALPKAAVRRHIMLRFKPDWVPLEAEPQDICMDDIPTASIEDWHKERGLWIA